MHLRTTYTSVKLLLSIGVCAMGFLVFIPHAYAATNINSTYKWAWNDVVGWIDFATSGTVEVENLKIKGFATSVSVGEIALDCATSPNGDICSSSNFSVINSNGALSGWAWSDTIGWISFCGGGSTTNCPGTIPYGVIITTATGPTQGDFSGWAWNDVIGWISFNCANDHDAGTSGVQSICGTIDYKVKTSWTPTPTQVGNNWLISNVFDTCPSGVDCGATLNTIFWKGSLNGGSVYFQIATSNCVNGAINSPTCNVGTWEYKGPGGSDSYNPAYANNGSNPAKINAMNHLHQRYFRYKIFLDADQSTGQSPIVSDVVVNWSP